jgi:transposase
MSIPTRSRPGRLSSWRGLLEGAAGVFGSEPRSEPATPAVDVKTLHAKIGELTLTNDFLSGALSKAGLLSAKR